jgi:hypothetical protein
LKKRLLIASLFLGLVNFSKADDIIYQSIGPYGGLNNTDSPIVIPANKAQDLLNVEVSLTGKSVLKRKGYALFSNLSITTSPVHGVHNFFDSSGNSVDLYFNDSRMSSSIGGGAVAVIFSTGPNGATYQCVDSQGFAYCANTGRTSLIKTNGATATTITTVNSTGTMVTVTPERLATSGFAEAPNRVDFSKANDFANWTIGSAGTDATQFTIVAPGSRVTHITYAFGKIIGFKDSSMFYIYMGQEEAQADWEIKIIDPRVGTLDNTSVYWEGILYFRGQDGHIYAYDGSSVNKITRDLQGTIQLSGNRTTNSWSQSSQTDFETSSMTPQGYLSTTILPGSIVLGTATAISDFVDDSSSDFGLASSVVFLDTTSISGSVTLSTAPSALTPTTPITTNVNGSTVPLGPLSLGPGSAQPYRVTAAQSFTSTYTFLLSSVTVVAQVSGSIQPSTYTVQICGDNSGFPGSVIISTDHFFTGVASDPNYSIVSIVFNSSAVISNGNRYWIKFTTTSESQPISLGQGTNATTDIYCGSTSTSCLSSFSIIYRTNGFNYSNTGYFVSRSFDNGFSTNTWLWEWDTFYASGTVTSGGASLSYQTQVSSDSACANCWDSLVSVSSGSRPTSAVKRYFRYKPIFSGTNVSTSPVLNYVEQNLTSRLRPGGTYYSQVRNIGTAINSWDTFSVNKQDNGGTHTFYIRASSTAIGINSSTPAWVSIGAGATPSISTYPYVQVKDEFVASKSTQNPILSDFTVAWFEGSASDKAYATYFNDAVWWSVPVGVSVSSNTRVLRLDLINADWYIYDIGTNGMLVRNNSLYFGSSSEGKIFKFGDVDNDNGLAINAYWKSKDFVQGNPFVKKEFVNLSVSVGSVANSSMTVTYTVDGSSQTSYQFPLYAGASYYKHYNKNMPAGKIGNTFNVQFGNNGADQFFETFAVQYGFRDKPWVPSQ